jgi:hypothetical protein
MTKLKERRGVVMYNIKHFHNDYLYLEEMELFKSELKNVLLHLEEGQHKVILCSHYICDADLLDIAQNIKDKYMNCYIEFKNNGSRYMHFVFLTNER